MWIYSLPLDVYNFMMELKERFSRSILMAVLAHIHPIWTMQFVYAGVTATATLSNATATVCDFNAININHNCLFRRFAFDSFNLSSVKTEAEGFDENCLVKATPNSSSYAEPAAPPNEDYLMIPSATTSAKKLRVNKFCGNTINGQTATANAPGPFVLQFHSDNKFKAGDDKAREGGFSIKYKVQ